MASSSVEYEPFLTESTTPIKKTSSRKKKTPTSISSTKLAQPEQTEHHKPLLLPLSSYTNVLTEEDAKKKPRKPRNSKMIVKPVDTQEKQAQLINVILHLRCSLNDLYEYNRELDRMVKDPYKYTPDIPPEIQTLQDISPSLQFYQYDTPESFAAAAPVQPSSGAATTYSTGFYSGGHVDSPGGGASVCAVCKCNGGGGVGSSGGSGTFKSMMQSSADIIKTIDVKCEAAFDIGDAGIDDISLKEINTKLKQLKVDLYKNSLDNDIKSACFWCTCDFDNTSCRIPKYETDGVIYGYGSFCRPECAVAYLMRENIDDSTKFERYHLLNRIYGKVYNCKRNIKPAPNPYYLLDKFYGTLSIQEYRKLLKTEHLLLVIDKPLTRVLPELHEDNEDVIMNVYGMQKNTTNNTSIYKVKKQSEKQSGPSKNAILKSKFSGV